MKSMPSQNGKHRNYLQNTSFSAFPCQLNKPLISAKVTEWYAPPGRVLQGVRSRRAVPPRPVAVRTSRVPSRRIAARLPRPVPLPCAISCPVAVGRDVPIAPPRLGAVRGFAPSRPTPAPPRRPLSPRPVARSSYYTRAFPALHCPWWLPTPDGAMGTSRPTAVTPATIARYAHAPSRTPLRDPHITPATIACYARPHRPPGLSAPKTKKQPDERAELFGTSTGNRTPITRMRTWRPNR